MLVRLASADVHVFVAGTIPRAEAFSHPPRAHASTQPQSCSGLGQQFIRKRTGEIGSVRQQLRLRGWAGAREDCYNHVLCLGWGGCWSAIAEGQCFEQGRYPADKSTHVMSTRSIQDHALGCTCKTRLPEAQCLTPSLHRRRDVSPRPASSAGPQAGAAQAHWTPACFEAIVEVTGKGCEKEPWKCKLKASRKRVKQCCKQ